MVRSTLVSKVHRWGKWEWGVTLILFLLLTARACAWGMEYWPQLDDYIQLSNYPSHSSLAAVQERIGILGARPLAVLGDFYLWGQMFSVLIVGVALISLMLALSAVMFRHQLGRYFTVSPLFLVIVTLLPLGVEGTYWMAASSRVVCGLFAAALSSGAFLRWMDTGRWYWALGFVVLQLLPMGFYEQSGVFAVTLVVGLAILEVIRSRRRFKRALLSLWSLPAMGVYFVVTRQLAVGDLYSGRAKIILPTDPIWKESLWPEILHQLKTVFGKGNFYTLVKGFQRGVEAIISGELILWVLVTAALCLLFWFLCARCTVGERDGEQLSPWLELIAGILLFLAPLTIFLVLENPWFSFRGAVTSFVGLALVCDTVVTAVWRRLPGQKKGLSTAAVLLAFIFCVAGASEIGDYRANYQADQKVGAAVVQRLAEDFPDPLKYGYPQRIGILNILPTYLEDQNYFYHEHIHGCTESSWAFQGLLSYLGGQGTWDVTPLPVSPMYYHWNQTTNRPETFDVLYYYNGQTIQLVELTQTGEHQFQVWNQSGELIGSIWEEPDGKGYFAPA